SEGAGELLYTDNESNVSRLFGWPNPSPYVKDAINDYVVGGSTAGLNPAHQGTKDAAHYALDLEPGGSRVLRLRLTAQAPTSRENRFADFDAVFAARSKESDEFYAAITPAGTDPDHARVMRQGLAGMLWSKQTYLYDV